MNEATTTTEAAGASAAETLAGGAIDPFKVRFLDGRANEQCYVRQLPVKDYPAYAKAMENEVAMVALLTGKDEAWAEALTPESHKQIIETGEKVNLDFFLAWFQRRERNRQRLMTPDQEKRLEAAMLKILEPLLLKLAPSLGSATTKQQT